MAVWALRVGYLGLAVAMVGLIIMLSGSTPWVLAVGVIIWLAAAAITSTGFFWARHGLPESRPGYWSMRLTLIHDSVHPRSSRSAFLMARAAVDRRLGGARYPPEASIAPFPRARALM